MMILIVFYELFLRKIFPDKNIPGAAWNDTNGIFRNLYKITLAISNEIIAGSSYEVFFDFLAFVLCAYMVY